MNDNVNSAGNTGVVDAGSENVTSTRSSTSYPFQHAYYHSFPSFCKESYDITPLLELSDAISNGRSFAKDEKNSNDRNKVIGERVHHLKYIETRASDLRKLMKSLDITKIDFTKLENDEDDTTSNDGVGTANDDDDDDDDDEQEDELEYDDDNSDQEGDELLFEDTGGMEVDNEEEKTDGNMNNETSGAKPTTSMAMFVKKCCRLNTILNTILDSRHVQVLTKEDFCQFLLQTLIMITATLRRDPKDGKLRVHLENIGQYYHVIWNVNDEDEGMTTTTSGEKDTVLVDDDNNKDSGEQQQFDRLDRMTDPFALPAPARENLLSFAENLLTSWFIRSASLQFRLRVPVPKDGAPLVALTMQGNNNSSITGATAAASATSAETRGNDNDIALVLHWKPLYRLLYRTNPKIDEYSPGVNPPSMAHSRRNSILKKTSHLASLCRHFYDQHGVLEQYHSSKQNGVVTINLRSLNLQDTASNEIWSMICAPDLKRTHTNVMFRGVVMMYLFLPWSCTPAFYKKVIPECIQCWSSVDRCNDFDYLWLQLFSRARFYDTSGVVNWTYIRKKAISNCAYWLQIPITGSSNDRSFPTIRPMKSRTIPATLKSLFSITGNAYQEGLEFVDRLSALLIFCVGRNDDDVASSTNNQNTTDGGSTSRVCLDDVEVVENTAGEKQHHVTLSSGTADLLRFLSFVGPYFNPTNVGGWTFPLGVLMTGLCTHFARRLGLELGQSLLMESYPAIAQQMLIEDFSLRECIPPEEIPPILDALLPLVQQSIYSKDGFVGKAGEQCLFFLMQISPQHVCPYFLNFASKALDVSAIHQSHQAPSALGVLARLLPSTLRRTPSEVLQRIPEISSLLLAGIDSNDRKKTIHTLSLVHSITSWLPVGAGSLNQNKKGGSSSDVNKNEQQMGVVEYDDGTLRLGHNLLDRLSMINSSKEFHDSLMALSNRTVLHRPAIGDVQLDRDEALVYVQEHLMEASMALGDWSLLFLERIYDLMRAAGKLEKVSKDHLGASARQSANDASQAKTFSKQLMTTLMRVFLSMDAATHHKAVESVFQFITSETLPYAAKDAAGLCTAACTGDYAAEGFDVLVPALTSDLERQSLRTVTYRLRCLTGTVKFCGTNLLHPSPSKKKNHRDAIVGAIHFCLNPTKSSPFEDKHLFKVGCKLLRHTLASQVEAYPLFVDCVPNTDILGKGFELHNHDISWHVPSGTQIDFSVQLMEQFAFTRLRTLLNDDSSFTLFEGATSSGGSTNGTTLGAAGTNIMVAEWRKTFKILKYTLRGGIGIMLDDTASNTTNNNKGDVDVIESTTGTYASGNDHDLCPVERDQIKLIETSSMQSQQILKGLRGKLCVIMTNLLGVIANETYEAITEDSSSSNGGSTSTTATTTTTASTILSFDTKICAEISEVSDLLLTFRESHQISGDKHSPTFDKMEDEVMATQLSHIISSLERVGAWTTHHDSLLRDGEDGGLIISRALRISKIWESYLHLRVNASYNIPRRMMKERMKLKNVNRFSGGQQKSNKSQKRKKHIYFSPNHTMKDVKTLLSTYLNFDDGTPTSTDSDQEQRTDSIIDPLDAYEGLLDGLQSLSCHPKLHVRSSANEALDSGLSCFSFLARQRVSRLLQAIQLNDETKHGKYGVPSCERLASIQPTKPNEEEGDEGSVAATLSETTISIRRKRLAEVLKGVCNLLSKPRMIRHVAASEATRYHFIQTLCNTERLLSIMPKEELQKMVHFLQVIFSKFRNRWHELPRYTQKQKLLHNECLLLLLNELDGGVLSTTGTSISSNADTTKKRESAAAIGDIDAISPDAGSETDGRAGAGTDPPQDDEAPAAIAATTGVAAANTSTSTTTTDLTTAANTKKMMHWRNQLLTIWFLTHLLDPLDVEVAKAEEESSTEESDRKKNTKLELLTRVWNLTFSLIEKHEGQPIQRAALGLMGRLLTFAQCSEFDQTKTTVTQILQSRLSDETFSRNLCMAFAFNHRQDTSFGGGHKAQWSAGVEDILRDASTNVSPLPFFPLLRNDSLTSSNFKLSHAFALSSLLKLLNSTVSTTVIDQVCQHWLKMAKELADTSPSEDQKNMQVTAWELFAAVFRFYMKSSNPISDKLSDTTESSEKWKHIFDFFDDVLVPLPYELSYSAYDAIKFSIDSLKPIQYKPLSDWLLLRTSSSLWQQQLAWSSTAVVDDSTGEEDSVVSATSARVDGFSSQSKWLRLGSAVLSELRNESYLLHNGRRHEGDSFVFERLEEGGEGQQGNTTTTNQLDEDDGGLQEMLQQLVDKLLPLLLNAVGHPYEKCRSLIASLLYYFCMIANCTKTLSLESENESENESESDFTFLQDKAVSSLIQALGRNDVSTMNFKERLNCLKTTKQFLLYSLHRGDVIVDYRNLIIPLLPVAFSSLKLSDDDDDNSKTTNKKAAAEGNESSQETTTTAISAPDRALEAEVANDFRYMLSCVGSVFVTFDRDAIGEVLDKLDHLSKNDAWHIRQAVAHYLRCFQGCHKFIFTSDEANKATNIVASLLADERREVSSGAMGALTGILAVTDVATVSKLVDEKLIIAKRSLGKKKKKKIKQSTTTTLQGASSNNEAQKNETTTAPSTSALVVGSKEKRRLSDQQSSVYFLCAVVLARPYDTPAFVPVALEALSRHSFEQRAPLAVRDTVKKCFSEFKRTHMTDNWEAHRQQFTQAQLEALEDVVSTPHYYA